jgi:hypothetical protein
MTERAEWLRLEAELTADIAAASALAQALAPWATTEASEREVLIPAALLHHLYTAIERVLSRLALAFEGSEPMGPDSHRRLLNLAGAEVRGVRPAWLPAQQVEVLRDLLGFRHLFRHGYGATYRPERLRELAALAVRHWPDIHRSLDAARATVAALAAPSP